MIDLEAIAKDAAERVHKNGGCVPQMAFAPIMFALQDALSTTPARAEAQDGGAAGEREALALDQLANAAEVVRRLLHKTKEVQGPAFREAGISFTASIDHARAVLRQRDALNAHPSPTPAADADRVRIACEKEAIAGALGNVLPLDIDWQHIRVASQAFVEALAALKSTAAKEGGEG